MVAEISPVDIAEIFQLRILLEPFAAKACIERVDHKKIKELRDAAEKLYNSQEKIVSMLKENISLYESHSIHELHVIIINASGNRRLIKILDMLQSQIKWILRLAEKIPGRIIRSIGEHISIADAILAEDESLAEKMMFEHLQAAKNDILDVQNYKYIYED